MRVSLLAAAGMVVTASLIAWDAAVKELAWSSGVISAAREVVADPRLPVSLGVYLLSDVGSSGQAHMLEAMHKVNTAFAAEGIELRVVGSGAIELPMPLTLAGLASTVGQARQGAQIAVVLTARDIKSFAPSGSSWLDVAGWADPQRGLVLLDARRTADTEGLASTLQHELAHLFYVAHDPPGSPTVMAPCENNSLTWSPTAKATLAAMRYRPWW